MILSFKVFHYLLLSVMLRLISVHVRFPEVLVYFYGEKCFDNITLDDYLIHIPFLPFFYYSMLYKTLHSPYPSL